MSDENKVVYTNEVHERLVAAITEDEEAYGIIVREDDLRLLIESLDHFRIHRPVSGRVDQAQDFAAGLRKMLKPAGREP